MIPLCISIQLHPFSAPKPRERESKDEEEGFKVKKGSSLLSKFIWAEFSLKLKSAFILCLWLLHINILSVAGFMRFLGFLHTAFKDRIITMINKVKLYTAPASNIHTLQDVLPIAIFNLHNLVYTHKITQTWILNSLST